MAQPRVHTRMPRLATAKMPRKMSFRRSMVRFMVVYIRDRGPGWLAARTGGIGARAPRPARPSGLQTAPEPLLPARPSFPQADFEAIATHEGVGPGQAGDRLQRQGP